jgi:serine/threonine-protein kinase RsbW
VTADPIEIRALRPDEAQKLVACVRRCYGDSYIDPAQYDGERIAQAIAEGRRHALVALSPSGEVVGHMGITLRRQGDRTADAGMTLVDPRYRGRGIAHELGAALGRAAQALELVGAHDYPVTVHGATQRVGADHLITTGLLLDNMPADVSFQEMEPASRSRSASLIRYLPLSRAPERTSMPPPRYEAVIRWLCARAELPRRFAAPEAHPTAAVTSRIEIGEDTRRDILRIAVVKGGSNLAADITARLRKLGGAPAAIHIDLPLADPAAAAAAEACWSLGFFFGGLLPEFRDGDVLRLQRLAAPPSSDSVPVLESEAGRALCRFVLRDAATPRDPAPSRGPAPDPTR